MENLLFISNISSRIDAFSKAAIYAAKECGLNFHYASNWSEAPAGQLEADEKTYGIMIHDVDISRSPVSRDNKDAYEQIKDIVEECDIHYIHCNTPVGGVIGRLMDKRVKRVIYEAHGFHFYKGAPLVNWGLYYPVEKLLAKQTDAIITINKDDYKLAKKHFHPRSKIYYVPGVGIELEQWQQKSERDIRDELGYSDDDFVVLAVGRLEKNENCKALVEAAGLIRDEHVRIAFCGDGEDKQMLRDLAEELGIADRVKFLGNRTDMVDIYHMADCFVLASFREGLSRSIMEAMACGLPCIVANIRGNRDLVDEEGGLLFDPKDPAELTECIYEIFNSEELQKSMRDHNLKKIKQFSFERVVKKLVKIYKEQYGIVTG